MDNKFKSIIRKTANLINKEKVSQKEYRLILNELRPKIAFTDNRKSKKKIIKDLPEKDIYTIKNVITKGANNQHLIIFYVLYYTGIRVNELVNIKIENINLDKNTIHIIEGKGDKERLVLIPPPLKDALFLFINSLTDKRTFLFETREHFKFTTRSIHRIIANYGKLAKLNYNLHPHLFRHNFITILTRAGMAVHQIKPLTGHSSTKSLEIYSHVTPYDVCERLYDSIGSLN